MFTKEQLLQAIPEIPAEFSLADLEAVLRRPRPLAIAPAAALARPASLPPAEAADWDYYTSSEAQALYARFPVSPELLALRGIAGSLTPEDLQKSAADWEAERINAKYGV